MKTYRVYEAIRNAGGGLDPVGTGWEEVEANSAQAAADAMVLEYAGLEFDERTVFVATDDDGDSAVSSVVMPAPSRKKYYGIYEQITNEDGTIDEKSWTIGPMDKRPQLTGTQIIVDWYWADDPPPDSNDAADWDAWRLRYGYSGCHH